MFSLLLVPQIITVWSCHIKHSTSAIWLLNNEAYDMLIICHITLHVEVQKTFQISKEICFKMGKLSDS